MHFVILCIDLVEESLKLLSNSSFLLTSKLGDCIVPVQCYHAALARCFKTFEGLQN